MDRLAYIMEAEGGELSAEEYLDGLAELIADGTIWQLQGSWQRSAYYSLEMGFIDHDGTVLRYPEEVA